MRKTIKKTLALLLIVAVVSLALTGCKSKSEAPPAQPPQGEQPSEEPAAEEHPSEVHPTEETTSAPSEHPQ